MKIKIESDIFEISKRVKDIDENYYIVFDTKKNKYELPRCGQGGTYSLTCPYDNLDSRFFDLIYSTDVRFIDNIVEDIDKNNEIIEKKANATVTNQTDYMLREIYAFANNSSKELDEKSAFSSIWR